MKGVKKVLPVVVIVLILASTTVLAQDPNAIPVNKTVSPGISIVKFEGITYRIITRGSYNLSFELLDRTHHRLFIIPTGEEVSPYHCIIIQWGSFPATILDIGSAGGETYILGTETGYAEK